MPIEWPSKDPGDVIDNGFDWSPLIEDKADSIATSDADSIDGLVRVLYHDVITEDDTQATVTWLSGGEVDLTAYILLSITTTKGRTLNQRVFVKIAKR